jgi:zinc transport system substrate-binding protein
VLRLAALLVALLALSGCGSGGDEGRTVVAAFYPLAWVAEEVAADDIDVVNLTPAGAEPHDIELTARDIERVHDAELVLYLGRGFMPALEDAVEGQENAVDLLAGQSLRDGEESDPDPHIWLDPTRLATIAGTVADELGDPAAADDLRARLEQLDGELRDGLAECQRRELVTSHAAFRYLADAYGLRQIALTGISPEAEPSPRALEDLIGEVEEVGATTVFFESLVSPRLAETVAHETGARTAELDPLEGLSEDQLEAGADYVSVMRENLAALREALGCR